MCQRFEDQCKHLILHHKYKECEKRICESMARSPHSAIPHNLMGILLEKESNHVLAMKHFRAAYALEPNYIPARYNMELYGNLSGKRKCAYTEEDCFENRGGNV